MAKAVIKLTCIRDWFVVLQCDKISLNQKTPRKELKESVKALCADDTKAPVMLVVSLYNNPENGKDRSAMFSYLVRKTESFIPIDLVAVPDAIKMMTLSQMINGTMQDLKKIQGAVGGVEDGNSDEEGDEDFDDGLSDDDFMNRKPKGD